MNYTRYSVEPIYVIDTFLWFMARRGYTMQRSRVNLPFRDLDADVKETEDRESQSFLALFKNAALADQENEKVEVPTAAD